MPTQKIFREDDKAILVEIDPTKDYILIVNPSYVLMSEVYSQIEGLRAATSATFAIIQSADIEKSIKFVEMPKSAKKGEDKCQIIHYL